MMNTAEVMLIAFGLSADAFAVSVCIGLAVKQCKWSRAGIVGLYFGTFQAVMPVFGFLLAMGFYRHVSAYGDWIAFGFLFFIGLKMVYEGLKSKPQERENVSFSPLFLLPLAFATSIDALVVGISFAFMQVNIIAAVIAIGLTTFTLSAAGVKIGSVVGGKFSSKANIAGGVILMLMGFSILIF